MQFNVLEPGPAVWAIHVGPSHHVTASTWCSPQSALAITLANPFRVTFLYLQRQLLCAPSQLEWADSHRTNSRNLGPHPYNLCLEPHLLIVCGRNVSLGPKKRKLKSA